MKGMIKMWHPDSPGMKVLVPYRWWKKNREFATVREVGNHYASLTLLRDNT